MSNIHLGQTGTRQLLEEQEQVGRTCCLVMGTIAAELEVDYLLASPSGGIQDSFASKNEENHASSFAYALREGILFCHSLGEKQLLSSNSALTSQMPYEYHEPITHLLPCIMSLVSTDCLVLAISRFLSRASSQCCDSNEGVALSRVEDRDIEQADLMVSMLKLSTLIINDFAIIANSRQKEIPPMFCSKKVCQELRHSLNLWKNHLTNTSQWPSQTLSLNEVSDSLLALDSYYSGM